jgi:hypothetical protein
MPITSDVGLANRQIKDRFANTFSVGLQAASDKTAASQNNTSGVNDVLNIVPADLGFKLAITLLAHL